MDEGGDPVCWLHALCPECGAAPSDEDERTCWRCGAPRDGEQRDLRTLNRDFRAT